MPRLFMALVVTALLAALPSPLMAQGAVASDSFTLQLGDFTSQAQLDYPAGQSGPFPTVVLLHGGCDCDRDEAFTNSDGSVQSTIFKDIAQYLASRGFAVLRFNKRYVNGPGQVDPKFSQVKLADTLADAQVALAAARANQRVDASRIFLYGWSEGSVIASAIAAEDGGLAGLILQGPVALSYRDTFLGQLIDSKLPFAASFTSNGAITSESLGAAFAQPNGWWAGDFADPSVQDKLVVNPFFDSNKDGVLDIEAEVRPQLAAYADSLVAPNGPLAEQGVTATVGQRTAKLKLPVLVLHGQNDGLTPPQQIVTLDAAFAGNAAYTRKEYPGLGHSLGASQSLIDTAGQFTPIAQQPLADTAAWLAAHSAAPAALPRTGEAAPNLWPLAALVAAALLLVGLRVRTLKAAR